MHSPLEVEICEEPSSRLEDYARVPIAFEVNSMLLPVLRDSGLGGFELVERPVTPPFVKDYDDVPGHRPTEWAYRFDLSAWGLLFARVDDGVCIGGAAVAWKTPGVVDLEGRRDLAVVWDLRVAPDVRGRGVGGALFSAAAEWAAARGCRHLKVETQNINVRACKLYVSQGCTLGAIHRFAYPELPDEVQLLWYKRLGGNQ